MNEFKDDFGSLEGSEFDFELLVKGAMMVESKGIASGGRLLNDMTSQSTGSPIFCGCT